MKKNEKETHFVIWENIFSLLLFFGWSFDFAFQRWFVELERCSYNILNHSKWRRIEKDISKYLLIGKRWAGWNSKPAHLGKKYISIQWGLKLRKPSILSFNPHWMLMYVFQIFFNLTSVQSNSGFLCCVFLILWITLISKEI
jgi:hypothetical protein